MELKKFQKKLWKHSVDEKNSGKILELEKNLGKIAGEEL